MFSFDGDSVKEFPSTTKEHGLTTLGIYDGKPMAIGGYTTDNRAVESFNLKVST